MMGSMCMFGPAGKSPSTTSWGRAPRTRPSDRGYGVSSPVKRCLLRPHFHQQTPLEHNRQMCRWSGDRPQIFSCDVVRDRVVAVFEASQFDTRPSTAWRRTRSTLSGSYGLHASPAHRSRCHRAARDIDLSITSCRDRWQATFRIPSPAPGSDRIYSSSAPKHGKNKLRSHHTSHTHRGSKVVATIAELDVIAEEGNVVSHKGFQGLRFGTEPGRNFPGRMLPTY